MRVLDLSGDAYERGRAQGAAVREAWKLLEHDFYTSEIINNAKPSFVPAGVVEIALKFWGRTRTRPAVERGLPSMHRRVLGLAQGLDIKKNYAWGLQYAEILFCLAGNSLAFPTTGCTQVHATPKATADGKPYSGRNYDFPNMLQPYQIVRRETPSEKDRFATMTVTQVASCGAHEGINEAGLLVAANNNRAWMKQDYDKFAIPYMMLLQEALETCSTVSEGIDFITKFPKRANAGFFGMIDEAGDCAVVEFTASRTSVRRPDDSGVIAQTNHFLNMTEANIPDGTFWKIKGMEGVEYSHSTKTRFAAADKNIHAVAGKITPQSIMSVLSDHSGDPGGKGDDCCVCCHGEQGSTLSSLVFDIRERTLWIADGTPCNHEYVKIDFRNK
ncbi:MAG: C45 family peptidase [bacterium]